MNATTKLALAFLALLAVGFGFVVYGTWNHARLAAILIGFGIIFAAPILFAAIWRSR